jgi:hypothetical protein
MEGMMPRKPDRIWTCPQCNGTSFQIIVSGDERNQIELLCDVICADCGFFYRPKDGFNRIPTEYFRELEKH